MNTAFGFGVTALSLATLTLLVSVPPGSRLGGESRRKVVHVGMGFVGASFGWLFDSPWAVTGTAALAAGAFLLVRWRPARRFVPQSRRLSRRMLGGLRRSGSASLGEIHFAAGVAGAIWITHLSGGQPADHAAAVMMLAVPDVAAAVVGRRFGKRPGGKSLAGTAAFVVSGLIVLWAMNAAIGLSADAPLLALTALASAAAEWAGRRGADNLLVPCCAAAVLAAGTL